MTQQHVIGHREMGPITTITNMAALAASSPPQPPPQPTVDPAILASAQRRREELRDLSKTFGHIPNVPIFSSWENRQACSNAAVHRNPFYGIYGNQTDGAFSVVVSRYGDNEDGGDVIIYSGTGGRKKYSDAVPPRRLRLGPQIEDQSWDHPHNRALVVSFLTGNPVRVIRSWMSLSRYAPAKGYRYDGLYRVASYWTAKGRYGKRICRCRLERLPNQPPLPLRPTVFPTRNPRGQQCLPNHHYPSDYCDTQRDSGSASTLQAAPEASSRSDVTMTEVHVNVKVTHPTTSMQHGALHEPSNAPRYRWNWRTNELMRLPTPDPAPVVADSQEEGEESHRCEDDATLVSSEDGRLDLAPDL